MKGGRERKGRKEKGREGKREGKGEGRERNRYHTQDTKCIIQNAFKRQLQYMHTDIML